MGSGWGGSWRCVSINKAYQLHYEKQFLRHLITVSPMDTQQQFLSTIPTSFNHYHFFSNFIRGFKNILTLLQSSTPLPSALTRTLTCRKSITRCGSQTFHAILLAHKPLKPSNMVLYHGATDFDGIWCSIIVGCRDPFDAAACYGCSNWPAKKTYSRGRLLLEGRGVGAHGISGAVFGTSAHWTD